MTQTRIDHAEEVRLNVGESNTTPITHQSPIKDIINLILNSVKSKNTTTSQTTVRLPPDVHFPNDITINNCVTIEPPRRIKLLLHLNFLLWVVTTIAFTSIIFIMYVELLTLQRSVHEMSQTVLAITTKYEFLTNTVGETMAQKPMDSASTVLPQKDMIVDNYAKDQDSLRSANVPFKSRVVDSEVNVDTSYLDTASTLEDRLDYDLDIEPNLKVPNVDGEISYRRNTRRPSTISSGPVVLHFRGALPSADIRSEGSLIGPWALDKNLKASGAFHLTEQNKAIDIIEEGLYLIYSQVYYENSGLTNSFSINVRKSGHATPSSLAFCSTSASDDKNNGTEISCYTSVVRYLSKNDRVYLQQNERNRTVILRDGYSFIGLVRLNNDVPFVIPEKRNVYG